MWLGRDGTPWLYGTELGVEDAQIDRELAFHEANASLEVDDLY
jgi:hypothetical protein